MFPSIYRLQRKGIFFLLDLQILGHNCSLLFSYCVPLAKYCPHQAVSYSENFGFNDAINSVSMEIQQIGTFERTKSQELAEPLIAFDLSVEVTAETFPRSQMVS